MFRFINAWLQAMFGYITAWLQSAAADDPDAASLQGTAAMDFPVTVSLGPLHRELHSSFKAGKNKLLDGVSEGEIQRLQEDLEILFTELKIVSEADDPSFTAKCWMKEVRELRYDTEDFFDEVLRPCAGDGDGTHRSALLTIILWIPSKLKRRHQVAKAFSDLWARVKDASQRRQSFQLGPATIRPEFGQGIVSRCSKPIPSSQLLDESMEKLVKLLALPDEEIVELLAFDTQDAEEQVQVVPIFGFAGVGKTTLARAFYRNFGGKFQCQAFVRVSRNPDMRMILSSILSQFKAPPVHGFSDVQDLIEKIRECLRCKRYLIVVDDLWASSTWDIISRAFPDGDCCSRIIVTTEIEDVALACCRYQCKYIYEMGSLNGNLSRKLFLGRVFGSGNDCAPDFKEVTDEIIRKCGGLPLATEYIASMLACEQNIEQWKNVRDSLPSICNLRTNPILEGLKEVLNITYNNLSPKLKTCLLYLIMYPDGYTVSKDELVKQWVAEDFIGEEQDREKTARDYFDELVCTGMIQPVDRNYNDEVLTCTVHHMVLDLIRYKSLEENFIISVSCSQSTPGLPDKVRRLSVQFGGAKFANIPAEFMMTQVRSLIFFGFLNCVPSVVEYKLLRVLSLHIWADQSKIFDLTRIGELFQLRYLKIDCNITVHLPDEIRQLKFLETLEVHAPVSDMPSDISCLPLLRTLGYFDLSKNSIENVQNLGKLSNLQDLHLTWSNAALPDNLKNNMQCLGSILWKLSNLESLTLVPAASSHADDLDDAGGASMGISGDVLSSMSSPPALLQRLELSGRCCMLSSLPEWTKGLGKLCILKIAVRKLFRKDIDILKGLPALMALSLYVWTAPVGKVIFDSEGFSVLRYFKFICAAPCVVFLEGAMPGVRELKLAFSANNMNQYSKIVAGLEYLIELKEITAKVWGTGADESTKRYTELALSRDIANHPCTPIIRVQCIDRIFYCEEDTSAITQEQGHWTLEKQHEVQDELRDPLCELISTSSTQSQTRDGGQNEGTYGSIEVQTQEQEHWTLENQHEVQEELLDPLPEILSTPRPREVLRQEQHWTLVKQQRIQEEFPDPLSTQTQPRDGVQGELIGSSMDVLTHEHDEHEHARLTLEKQHEIQEELLDPLREVLSTPSTGGNMVLSKDKMISGPVAEEEEEVNELLVALGQKVHSSDMADMVQKLEQVKMSMGMGGVGAGAPQDGFTTHLATDTLQYNPSSLSWVKSMLSELNAPPSPLTPSLKAQTQQRDEVQDGEIERSMKVLIQEQEQCTLEKQHEMTDREQDQHLGRLIEVVAQEEHSTMQKEHEIERELLDPLPELLSNPSTETQAVTKMQNRGIERSNLCQAEMQNKLDDNPCIQSYHSAMDPRLSALFVKDAHLVGIDGPRDDLAKWIVEVGDSSAKHHHRVLSIVGDGGLGKTTLANGVYQKIKGHFHCHAFVSVSHEPDMKKIFMDLISQFSSHRLTEKIDNWDERMYIKKLRELLQDKRYLVFIDDIWSMMEWNIIKLAFPKNNCSSRIITTTRLMNVAMSCCTGGDDCVYKMQPLSDFHSKKLFFKQIFWSEDGPDMLEEVSNEILGKCGGLPLAIISMSSLFANRPANKKEWEKLRRSIRSVEGIRRILCLSYNDLPDNLKTCLLYLSNFPEDCVIERDRLVRRWIAEGFISEVCGQNQQEVAESYFYELINKRMIQAVNISYDGKARACRVHDMILDLLISKSAEDNFVTVFGSGQTGLVNRDGFIRRLSVQQNTNLVSVLANKDLSHVRSLTVTSSSCIEDLPSLARFENLRVLDFEGCDRLENYHMNGMDKLFQLKYLSLRGTWISHIPSEVVMLHSLETLDIRETDVEELPAGIVHLTKLQHLIASTDYGSAGIKIPNGIGNMKNLRILLGCSISPGSADALDELGNLANLNDLDVEYKGIGSEYKSHEEMFLSSLCTLGSCKLQSFRIRRCRGPVEFLELWSPPPFSLQRFEMSGCYSFRCIPGWISPALTSLAYLEINIVEVTEKDLLILGEIPALLYLGLTCEMFRQERLSFQGGGFRCLKRFVYDAIVLPSGNLLFEGGALPMLEDLGLIYCISTVNAYVFNLGIQHLRRLKNVQVRLYKEGATSSDIASAAFAIRNEANVHPNRPRVTLTEHARRVDYCSEECPNRAVTDSELVASRTKQKRT